MIMNMQFLRASRVIAVGALAVILPALACASDVDRGAGFKMAMGPTSAAQKNQADAVGDAAPVEAYRHLRHRNRHKHHTR